MLRERQGGSVARPPLAGPVAPVVPGVNAPVPAPVPVFQPVSGGWSQPLGFAPGTNTDLPRGIRNNNPGNIEYNRSVQWVGQVGSDGRFIIFSDPVYGIRAMARILASYRARGIVTVEKIIETWAPPHENNTAAYIQFVEQRTGWSRYKTVNEPDYPRLIDAITFKENSLQPYSSGQLLAGVAAANSEGSYA